MIRLLILYGHPKDPKAFLDHYYEKHIPIAKKMKGLKKWTVGKAVGMPDGKPSPYFYIADLYAESRAALEAILDSPEGRAAVADVPNFATGGVTFIYTDMEDVI
ncbi:MAG: EthD family reductase [Holophaga sp.]|nr:EthD family reductase [Holophaga sp.]